jgi:hypothetical protein
MPRLKATPGEIERYLKQLAETPMTIRSYEIITRK